MIELIPSSSRRPSSRLTFLAEAFCGQEVFGHLTLDNSERNPSAELAAELLQTRVYQIREWSIIIKPY